MTGYGRLNLLQVYAIRGGMKSCHHRDTVAAHFQTVSPFWLQQQRSAVDVSVGLKVTEITGQSLPLWTG